MRTISSVVEEVIGRSPLLGEVIGEGLGNCAEIARRIRPQVEARLMEKVSVSAVAMALHRLAKHPQKSHYGIGLLRHIKNISVRSDLVQYVLPNTLRDEGALEAISRAAQKDKELFFNVARGLRETVVIVSRELERELQRHPAKADGIKRAGDLSAITVHLPESTLTVPGVYYPILKAIAEEGISLVEITSVRTELSLIVADGDVDRAFSAVKKLIS